jgi:DNA-binding NtrC family response regulator/pSer/pThr/pTyr-binding forkhead associated (FHA) protein
MAELILFRRTEELMRLALDGRRFTLGRASSNDLLVPDAAVSRQQCALERRDGRWRLDDLSGRGTELRGERTRAALLEDGADIGLGQWRAVFALESGSLGNEATQRKPSGNTVVQQFAAPPVLLEAESAQLRVVTPEGETFHSLESEVVVGSGPSCAVRVDDPFVSAAHLNLRRTAGGLALRDLGSRNGTFVGPARVWEAEVPFGTAVRLGSAELTLLRTGKGRPEASYEGMVGNDPAMRKVFDTIDRVAPSSAPVAIFGESGTGKELVARAVHARSPRAERPFVPVNCGALSPELVEAELFGHEKGAFTGADRARKGAFEEANGGTIFLDEIGELPLSMQAKLLRVLELGEIKRVGSSRPLTVDARVVAATNRDLRALVRRGGFREDLYWRLCVVPVQLPPLRARRGDLAALLAHFVRKCSPPGSSVELAPEAISALLAHDWPGNVRELRNTVHRTLLLRSKDRIDAQDVQFDSAEADAIRAADAEADYSEGDDDLVRVNIVDKTLDAIGDEVFVKTCRRIGASATAVARALGVSRGFAYRRMEKLGVTPGGDSEEAPPAKGR